MRSAAALLLLSLAAPTAEPPLTYRTAHSTGAYRTLPPFGGRTYWLCWDSKPRVLVAEELEAPQWARLRGVVRAHEADHQALASGMGCGAWNATIRIRDVQVAAEVRAFCAGVREGVRNGWFSDIAEGIWSAAYDLSGGYPHLAVSFIDAHARLSKTCGATATGSP